VTDKLILIFNFSTPLLFSEKKVAELLTVLSWTKCAFATFEAFSVAEISLVAK